MSVERNITASQTVLAILQIFRAEAAVDVDVILRAAGTIGIESSTTRVALSRLSKRGLVHAPVRGRYRLTDLASPVAQHIDAWREPTRTRAWDGSWLAVHLPSKSSRTRRGKSKKALWRLGFREVLDLVWLRPDNLTNPLVDVAAGLGLEPGASWLALKPEEGLKRNYVTLIEPERIAKDIQRLQDAIERFHLSSGPVEERLAKGFHLGRLGIQVLAFDPLLPASLLDPAPRRRCAAALALVDEQARADWHQHLFPDTPTRGPS